jgi:hypothetical protein
MAQTEEGLPSQNKALTSNYIIAKRRRKTRSRKRRNPLSIAHFSNPSKDKM